MGFDTNARSGVRGSGVYLLHKVEPAVVVATHPWGDSSQQLVAEGVEDEAAFTELSRLGCDLIQGYYLSRPMPAEALNAWLSSRRLAADPV